MRPANQVTSSSGARGGSGQAASSSGANGGSGTARRSSGQDACSSDVSAGASGQTTSSSAADSDGVGRTMSSSAEGAEVADRTSSKSAAAAANRGLFKDEVMEVAWMMYPPDGIKVDPLVKATWMRPVVCGEDAVSGQITGEVLFVYR